MARKEKEPKPVKVPMPGDGYFWEQIQQDGKPEYVFYRPPTLNSPEALSYDHFHVIQAEEYTTHYHPLKMCMWEPPGPPEEPGSDLWNEIKAYVWNHIDFRDRRLYDVKTGWIMATWLREAFSIAPYWRYLGTKNTGKTRGLEVDQHLCYRAVLTPSITEATLYRLIEKYHVTYLLDEAESYNIEQKQAIQNVLNSGYRRGQIVPRCETAENGEIIIVGYSPFGPKGIAGTKVLKDTLESRCIPSVMERNTRPVNFTIDIAQARRLRGKLLLWRFRRLAMMSEVSENSEGSEGIVEAPPELHSVKDSRIIEIFSPLIALADNEEAKQNIVSYAMDLYNETQEEEGSGEDAQVLHAITDSHQSLEAGKFSTRQVTDLFNQDKPESEKWKTRSIGRIIKTLGFKPKRMTGGASGYIYDAELVKRLSERYGLGGALLQPSLGSLSSLSSPNEEALIGDIAKFFKELGRDQVDEGKLYAAMKHRGHKLTEPEFNAILKGYPELFELDSWTVTVKEASHEA